MEESVKNYTVEFSKVCFPKHGCYAKYFTISHISVLYLVNSLSLDKTLAFSEFKAYSDKKFKVT